MLSNTNSSPGFRKSTSPEIQSWEELAAIIAARRESFGLTQMELGYIAELQDGYVSKLELTGVEGRTPRKAGQVSLYRLLKPLGIKLLPIFEDENAIG